MMAGDEQLSAREQVRVQRACENCALRDREQFIDGIPPFRREAHISFLIRGLRTLPAKLCSLDASRPWLVFWILHSLELLDGLPPSSDPIYKELIDFLNVRCQHPDGGYGGGPGQFPHLAPTYAALMSLAIIGTEEAFSSINVPGLARFLRKVHSPNGGFRLQEDGEEDVRGVYCALVSASLCHLLTPDLVANTADWLHRCQTYEGGIGGAPGVEAHGGYTYCGIAALCLLAGLGGPDDPNFLQNKPERLPPPVPVAAVTRPEAGKIDPFAGLTLDMGALLGWLARRQQDSEGGFSGRTNKLVDACYSFWQGGASVLTTLLARLLLTIPASRFHVLGVLPASGSRPAECDMDGTTDEQTEQHTHEEEPGEIETAPPRAALLFKGQMAQLEREERGGVRAGTCCGDWLFDQRALLEYTMHCSQVEHGFRDKPDLKPDYYHTCYALSGASLAQHGADTIQFTRFYRVAFPTTAVSSSPTSSPIPPPQRSAHVTPVEGDSPGPSSSPPAPQVPTTGGWDAVYLLHPTDPVFNVGPEKVARMQAYFAQRVGQ